MRQDNEDTGVDDSCCERRPVSAGDAMNALDVLRPSSTCLSSLAKRRPRQVGRRSEEGLIEQTQHSPPCRRNHDESYYSPAMVLWRRPSGQLFAVLPDSLYGCHSDANHLYR